MLQRRLFCTIAEANLHPNSNAVQNCGKWGIKQVTKSNFSESLDEIGARIADSDFIAVSLQTTGAYSSPWKRHLPFDTAEIGYLKARHAAERFQILQFAVCPFSFRASKVIAHPYNFHLFPRDELKVGLPSYSFSCQPSYLVSLAREGFDFNACIADGISYLSRAQELAAKDHIRNPSAPSCTILSPPSRSVADSIFVERIKSRVKHWIDACNDLGKKPEDVLISSLRRMISAIEVHGSRPCLNIDTCSQRQVNLVLETLKDFVDVVPLLIPANGSGIQTVRAILTSSQEDKDLFENELQDIGKEHNKRIRGFREVVELIASSQKPVVAHNSMNDFTFIHSKFLAPLPSTLDEFRNSLGSVFPHILDVKHLIKELGFQKNLNNIYVATSYLNSRFFAPVQVESTHQAMSTDADKVRSQGHSVVKISELFAKLCFILKIDPKTLGAIEEGHPHLPPALKCYANMFDSCSTSYQGSTNEEEEEVRLWAKRRERVSSKNMVFLWGFQSGISTGQLKRLLHGKHEVFAGEYDVRLVDDSCAVVVFRNPGFSEALLEAMDDLGEGCSSSSLKEMVSEGIRAARYDVYVKVCKLELWKPNLADSLDLALEEDESEDLSGMHNDEMIYLDDL
ncbi:unnamed protein product [Cuscuta campestris]|uniref:Uncharacterized protein n=1 Tax=Cuscuta campestris TaxID=132261 RepID=A0A484NGJ4_9ASTE|nr:unnamed protein product [Cuscuta campestris]